jgi:HAD superfamily hydrolase (TIGR01458 family)
MSVRAVLVDLEGTLLSPGGGPLAGAIEAIAAVKSRGISVRFVTNVDSRPPAAVRESLRQYGFSCAEDDLVTPVVAAHRLLAAHAGARARLLVSPATAPDLVEFVAPDSFTHVVVGDCGGVLTYDALDAAFRALQAGAELLALQRGRFYQRPDGNHIDAGALVAALEFAADTRARLLGKPSADFFSLALGDVAAADAVMVGDDLVADVEGAAAVGLRAIQVRTGKYAADSPAATTVINSIADLPAAL